MKTSSSELIKDLGDFKRKLARLPNYLRNAEVQDMLTLHYRVVFAGGVGVGKSGLLERVIEVEDDTCIRLPKGINCVTRRPVIIRHNTDIVVDLESVQTITEEPLIVVDSNIREFIEFIDLPGLTGMARPDQPMNYPQHTLNLLEKYVQTADVIVLGLPADSDVVNNASLQFIRTWQLEDRVVGFVSKLDLIEEALTEEGFFWEQLREVTREFWGLVAVRNAPLLELNSSIKEVNAAEREFFNNSNCIPFTQNRMKSGIEELRGVIYELLRKQFSSQCNSIISRLFLERSRLMDQLNRLKEPNLLQRTLIEYTDLVRGELTNIGISRFIESFLFKGSFTDSKELFEGIDFEILLKNAQGLQMGYFKLEGAFKFLVRKQLKRTSLAVMDCLNALHDELARIIFKGIREEGDCTAVDEEFYDVKSTASSTSCINCGDFDLISTLMIPGLFGHLRNILQGNYEECQKYLEEYICMQEELISVDADFNAVLCGYYGGGGSSGISRMSSKDSLDSLEIPVNPIKVVDTDSGLFREFMSLIFPGTRAFKRVEYRPRRLKVKEEEIAQPQNQDEKIILLRRLLNVYCESQVNNLRDFVPKCLNHFLIIPLQRDLPLKLLLQEIPSVSQYTLTAAVNAEIDKIQRLLRVIEEIIN